MGSEKKNELLDQYKDFVKTSRSFQNEFELLIDLIQFGLNNGQSRKAIWQWLNEKDLFSGSYATFLYLCRKKNLHKQDNLEIKSTEDSNRLKSLMTSV